MAWTNQGTLSIGGSTIILQRGSGDDEGHRITIDGTPGDVYPVGEMALNGSYRGLQAEFDLTRTISTQLFIESTKPSLSDTEAVITITVASARFDRSIAIADGGGTLNSWAIQNSGGGNTSATLLDTGGGVSDNDMAADFKTQIEALFTGITVERALNVLTLTAPNGLLVDSNDPGFVVT